MTVIPRIFGPLVKDPAADAELRQRVALYLLHNGHAPVRRLSVSAKDGVVCLRGTVPTYYVRQLGVECARRVAGVRELVDQIEVAHSEGCGPTRRPR